MYQLAIFFANIFVVLGKEESLNDFWYIDYLETFNEAPSEEYFELSDSVGNDGSLWVLDLDVDTLNSLKLRPGTNEENDDFESAIGPLIDIFESRHTVKKHMAQGVINTESSNSNENVKDEIMKILNKFLLSAHTEPDTQMTESSDERNPSLALHFKGLYTSLILNFERNQWHFFVAPPSPLSTWFYEKHNFISDEKSYVEVPADIQKTFYDGLLKLLGTCLRIPM